MEDHSPKLALYSSALANTTGLPSRTGRSLDLTVKIGAAEAPYFLAQPHELTVFVDEKAVVTLRRPPHPARIRLGPEDLRPGTHRLVVNWASELGPVGVQAVTVMVADGTPASAGGGE